MQSYKQFISEAREEWRGPHEGKEVELMLANKKPIAMFNHYEKGYSDIKPHVDSGRFIERHFRFPNPAPNHHGILVGQPGQEKNMERLAEIMSSKKRPHREIGRLFGYDEDHINKFVDEEGEGT